MRNTRLTFGILAASLFAILAAVFIPTATQAQTKTLPLIVDLQSKQGNKIWVTSYPSEHCSLSSGASEKVTCKSSAPNGNTISIKGVHDKWNGPRYEGEVYFCYVDYDVNKEKKLWNLRGVRGPCHSNLVLPDKIQILPK